MVDWKKEIKLSDLVRRKPKDGAEENGNAEESAPAGRSLEEATAPPPLPQPEPPAQESAPVLPEPQAVLPQPQPDSEVPAPLPGIHPPVPAAELPPEPEVVETGPPTPAPEKSSLLKKEISFRRRPRGPEAEKPKGEKTSLLKKEISFGRKPKEKASPKPPKQKPEKPKREKPSFWKLELSFRRKPKEADEPRSEPAEKKRRSPRRENAARKRHKRLVGLKIGASQLAAARVVNSDVPELVQVARTELEPGIVVGGELREPEALAEALKEFFRKHRLPRQDVRLGIANNRIGVRLFDLGGVDEPRQLENAIRFRAQEALPIPIEEAVLDYHVLRETTDEEGGVSRRILLVVAYRELIDRYVAACKKAGIKLAGIDLEAFALLRALGDGPSEPETTPEAALVVVSIGHERSTFAVSDGNICEFTRVLEWGGSTVNVAIARALDIAPSEAEPIKLALSLADASVPEGLSAQQAEAARESIRKQLQSFARELVSSLQFYQGQPGSLGIGEIVITGGGAQLPGLAEELHRLIGVRVRVGDPLARVRVSKRVKEREQLGSYAVAIGLGIED